ncbi:MAG: BREX-4 system phosphatase PglZ, partial [Syntrophaceae bacterium]|nr:BREX-4 system phosphatase PglZ [Syntrophaceae bacterium]
GAQNIILRTSLLESCCPVIGRFEVAVYHNAFEILNHKLENHLKESWGNSIQWEWLLSRIGNHNSLEKFAAAYFNVLDFEGPKLLMEWHKCDENTKWFVWLWGKVVKQEDELILYLIHNSENYETLLEDLYKVVFHKNLSLSELGYRRELLRIASNTTPPKSFLEILTKTQSPLKKLCYLTGLNSAEKQDIVSCVASLLLESTDPAIWMPYLEIVFPELSYYIQGLIHEDKFLESYFSSYSKSRIINQESNELKALTEKAARNKHYFVFKTRLSSLENHIENNEKIIWFDGLGLEWLGLIKGIVLEQKDVQMDFWPVRTNLPSITETNMSTDEKTKKYRGLDQFAHNYEYSFPEFFVKEIEYVSSSFRTIIDELAPGDSILITSDHGLTPASFNTQTIKGLSDVKPLHWGRDAEYQATIHELGLNEDLFINDGNRIFLANHGRLFGGAGCHGQIHGGATLEEALVPIIRLTKIAGVKATLMIQAPEIIVEKIKLDRHGSGVLRFRIFGAPKIVHVRIGMTRLVASVVDGNVWEVKLAGMNAGKMEAHVEQDNAYVGSIKFETTKGIKEVDLGL